jgi:hypothetical protein
VASAGSEAGDIRYETVMLLAYGAFIKDS